MATDLSNTFGGPTTALRSRGGKIRTIRYFTRTGNLPRLRSHYAKVKDTWLRVRGSRQRLLTGLVNKILQRVSWPRPKIFEKNLKMRFAAKTSPHTQSR